MSESTRDWVRFLLGFLPLTILLVTVANKLIRIYLKSILDEHKAGVIKSVDEQIADYRRDAEAVIGAAASDAMKAKDATEDHEKRIGAIETKIDLWWDAVRKGTAKLLLQAPDRED